MKKSIKFWAPLRTRFQENDGGVGSDPKTAAYIEVREDLRIGKPRQDSLKVGFLEVPFYIFAMGFAICLAGMGNVYAACDNSGFCPGLAVDVKGNKCMPGQVRDPLTQECSCPKGQQMLLPVEAGVQAFGRCGVDVCKAATITKVGSEFLVTVLTSSDQRNPRAKLLSTGNVMVTYNDMGVPGTGMNVSLVLLDGLGNKLTGGTPANVTVNLDFPAAQDNITLDQFRGELAVLTNNNVVVTYTGSNIDANDWGNAFKFFTMDGSPVSNSYVANVTQTGLQRDGTPVPLGNGNFAMVWIGAGPGESYGVFQAIYNPANPATPVIGETLVNTATTSFSEDAVYAVPLGPDRYVIVYHSLGTGGNSDIFFRIYDSNMNALIGQTQVNTFTGNIQKIPFVAALSDGTFMVVWTSVNQDSPTGGEGVYGRIYRADGAPQTDEFHISTYIPGNQTVNFVSVIKDTFFVPTWTSSAQDTDGSSAVYGQIFTRNGQQLGKEFKLNTSTTSTQDQPIIVESVPGKEFFAIWRSLSPSPLDTSGQGLLGQRFSYTADGCY